MLTNHLISQRKTAQAVALFCVLRWYCQEWPGTFIETSAEMPPTRHGPQVMANGSLPAAVVIVVTGALDAVKGGL